MKKSRIGRIVVMLLCILTIACLTACNQTASTTEIGKLYDEGYEFVMDSCNDDQWT